MNPTQSLIAGCATSFLHESIKERREEGASYPLNSFALQMNHTTLVVGTALRSLNMLHPTFSSVAKTAFLVSCVAVTINSSVGNSALPESLEGIFTTFSHVNFGLSIISSIALLSIGSYGYALTNLTLFLLDNYAFHPMDGVFSNLHSPYNTIKKAASGLGLLGYTLEVFKGTSLLIKAVFAIAIGSYIIRQIQRKASEGGPVERRQPRVHVRREDLEGEPVEGAERPEERRQPRVHVRREDPEGEPVEGAARPAERRQLRVRVIREDLEGEPVEGAERPEERRQPRVRVRGEDTEGEPVEGAARPEERRQPPARIRRASNALARQGSGLGGVRSRGFHYFCGRNRSGYFTAERSDLSSAFPVRLPAARPFPPGSILRPVLRLDNRQQGNFASPGLPF